MGAATLESVLQRQAFLERRQEALQQEMDAIREGIEQLSVRVNHSIWVSDGIAAILELIGNPLKKGVEIAIATGIIYVLTRINIKW